MAAMTETKLRSLTLFELSCGDAKAQVSSFGAQVISWKIKGQDIFYPNPCLVTDRSKALRAGAPICFPWFNKGYNWDLGREILPSHGPVRTSEWQISSDTRDKDKTSIGFSITTKSHLETALTISVRYTLGENGLKSEFAVENRAPSSNRFELALHSYFATPSPQQTQISGLSGQGDLFTPAIPIDKIFENEGTGLKAKFTNYNLDIENTGFGRSVVWHPGMTHDLADLPKDVSPVPFLCLESLTNKIEIGVGEKWNGAVRYTVS